MLLLRVIPAFDIVVPTSIRIYEKMRPSHANNLYQNLFTHDNVFYNSKKRVLVKQNDQL